MQNFVEEEEEEASFLASPCREDGWSGQAAWSMKNTGER